LLRIPRTLRIARPDFFDRIWRRFGKTGSKTISSFRTRSKWDRDLIATYPERKRRSIACRFRKVLPKIAISLFGVELGARHGYFKSVDRNLLAVVAMRSVQLPGDRFRRHALATEILIAGGGKHDRGLREHLGRLAGVRSSHLSISTVPSTLMIPSSWHVSGTREFFDRE
jgi:hypothetical protein